MARFVRSPDVIVRRIAGEVVLVPIATRTEDSQTRSANFYVLNESAELLWALLEFPAEAENLTQQLLSQYDIGPDQARIDVARFLSDLGRFGAVITMESA